ncbi:MAG: sulfatase-like hydrolase/transferase, partial [Cyclobacteriaceae bacterium]|nr:sulfatase-like hydrolase/transferase [Cyclobacteriaceae bacterium HetDA_MAG_MS6]
IDPDNIELPPYYPDHPVSRIDWAMYLQSVQEMDKELGRVISRLENEGLLENTAIFFFADHGRPHVRDKQWLYDGGIQVPLIVRFPNKKRAGEKNNRLVSLIDVPAASLSLAEINLPQALQGVNFLNGPSQRSFVYAARDRTDAVVDRIRCIRTSNLKYIRNYMPERPYTQFSHYKTYHYPVLTLMKSLHEKGELDPEQAHFMANTKPIEELYDLTQDPYELVNLAHDQTYQEELLALRDTLERFTSEIGDVGAYDPDDLEEVLKRRRKKYGKRWKKRNIDPHETPISEYLEWWERKLKIRN